MFSRSRLSTYLAPEVVSGIREVQRFGGADIAGLFWDKMEEKVAG
jgi:hypothetical protein